MANQQVKHSPGPLTNNSQPYNFAVHYNNVPQCPDTAAVPSGFSTPYQGQDVNNDVVVVTQPTGAESTTNILTPPKIQKLITPSLILIALCVLSGNILTLVCLIPALIFSIISNKRVSTGDYCGAKLMERVALGFIIAVFVLYMIPVALVGFSIALFYGIQTIRLITICDNIQDFSHEECVEKYNLRFIF